MGSSAFNSLTLYADDTHASWLINDLEDVQRALQEITIIFRIYQQFGMQVNPLKSGIILGVKGLLGRAYLFRHVHGPTGSRKLVLGPPRQQLVIPVHESMTYLGVHISYTNFEDATLDSRLAVAQLTRGRLIKVLHARRYLQLHKRLQLYTLCVRTAALYGLTSIGVTAAGLRRLHTFEVKHVRAIARSPVHLTRESTVQLYQRLRLHSPGDHLQKLTKSRIKALNKPQDPALPQFQQRHEELQQHILAMKHGLQEVTVLQTFACPTCGQYFDTLAGMRSHHTKAHGWRIQQVSTGPAKRLHGLRIQEHSRNDMPICKHCGLTLANWHQFRIHIPTSCAVLHSTHQGERPAFQSAAGPPSEPALQSAAGLEIVGSDGSDNPAPFDDVKLLLHTAKWKEILSLPGMTELSVSLCTLQTVGG